MLGPMQTPASSSRSTIIDLPAKEGSMTPNIADIIRQHVTLSVSCIDRLYLHAYMPKLQTSGGLCYFLHDHLGNPIPSPALFRPMHDRFLTAVEAFASQHRIPTVEFTPGLRKDDIVAKYRARFTRREGVVVIGTAQEKMRAFKAHKRRTPTGSVIFDFSRQAVAVKHFYFYVHDRDWGPAFLKIGTYVPYPVKLCLNGHEWVKQRLRRQHVRFTSLDNGFLACPDPGPPGHLRRAGPRRRASLLRSLVAAAPVADDTRGPRGRLRSSPRHLSAGSESHRRVRPPGARTALLRGPHPRESRPRSPQSRGAPVSFPDPTHDTTAAIRLSHASDHRRRRAQPAYRVQALPREA